MGIAGIGNPQLDLVKAAEGPRTDDFAIQAVGFKAYGYQIFFMFFVFMLLILVFIRMLVRVDARNAVIR